MKPILSNLLKSKSIALVLLASSICTSVAHSQVTVISSSSPSYSAYIEVKPISLINKVCNTGGFTYNINLGYTIILTPSSAPNLYTLEGTYICNNIGSFFSLPLTSATGTTTSASTGYFGSANCSTATPVDIECYNYVLRIFGPGIPDQFLNVNTPLPVKLISFDGRSTGTGVFLTWKTAAQTGNTQFNLQRSKDTRVWETIEQTTNTAQLEGQTYQYTDENPVSGTNYYRIQEVETDGGISYSKIIGLKAANLQDDISISPNPGSGNQIQINGIDNASDWNLTILNALSQQVLNSELNSTKVELPSMPAGMYYVQLTNNTTKERKLIKLIRN